MSYTSPSVRLSFPSTSTPAISIPTTRRVFSKSDDRLQIAFRVFVVWSLCILLWRQEAWKGRNERWAPYFHKRRSAVLLTSADKITSSKPSQLKGPHSGEDAETTGEIIPSMFPSTTVVPHQNSDRDRERPRSGEGAEKEKGISSPSSTLGMVLTVWFSMPKDPQRNSHMRKGVVVVWNFCVSVVYHGLHATVFHDGIPSALSDSLSKYPFLSFETRDVPANYSTNDYRFFLYKEWLMMAQGESSQSNTARPSYRFVVFADISDVFFPTDPFAYMGEQYEYYPRHKLFGQNDTGTVTSNGWMRTHYKRCSPYLSREVDKPSSSDLDFTHEQVLNAGFWGGEITSVLEVVRCMIDVFKRKADDRKYWNCNMPVYNYCMDQMILERKRKGEQHIWDRKAAIAHPMWANCMNPKNLVVHNKCPNTLTGCIQMSPRRRLIFRRHCAPGRHMNDFASLISDILQQKNGSESGSRKQPSLLVDYNKK